jgi:hypothetical protein
VVSATLLWWSSSPSSSVPVRGRSGPAIDLAGVCTGRGEGEGVSSQVIGKGRERRRESQGRGGSSVMGRGGSACGRATTNASVQRPVRRRAGQQGRVAAAWAYACGRGKN